MDGNNGTVKWYNAGKGYGLISNDNGGLSASPPSRARIYDPFRRAKVAFDIQPDPQKNRRLRTANVRAA
ncbi:MAG: cold-shock protein [Clostridiales bacterium]|nr:cold-shock protein [Clostridiales bacterium]